MRNSTQNPFIVTVMSKGCVTKSTNVANIDEFCADHGIKKLMIDTDVQPTLSSCYAIPQPAEFGLYEMFSRPDIPVDALISHTEFHNLDIIQSNDRLDKLSTDLHAQTGGVLKFNQYIKKIQGYDLIMIDTRGTRGITVEMTVLASDLILSPIKPEVVSAREFLRGTLGLYKDLSFFQNFGIALPPLKAVVNCIDRTRDARDVKEYLHQLFSNLDNEHIELLELEIPSRIAYREAASLGLPVHRHSPTETENIRQLCIQLFPHWADKLNA